MCIVLAAMTEVGPSGAETSQTLRELLPYALPVLLPHPVLESLEAQAIDDDLGIAMVSEHLLIPSHDV
jgi:hypothetical protein